MLRSDHWLNAGMIPSMMNIGSLYFKISESGYVQNVMMDRTIQYSDYGIKH